MARRYSRNSSTSLVSAILVIALLIGAVGVFVSIGGKDTRTISSFAFVKGDLDISGKVKKSETAIYTEDMFGCQGLIIDVDFEADTKYKVFYYRKDGAYMGSTELLNSTYEKGEDYANAKYARVVIYPSLANEKILFWEISSYANAITITVNKNQEFEAVTAPVFEDITSYIESESDFYSTYASVLKDAPFVYGNEKLTAFAGKHITRIGVPVKLIKDITKDCVFTVRVVSGDGSSKFSTVKTYSLKIEANTYTALNKVTAEEASIPDGTFEMVEGHYHEVYEGWYKVDEWVYFDVNIDVKPGQTLAFGDPMDTVAFSYMREEDLGFGVHAEAITSSSVVQNQISIFMDVWYEE